MAQRSRRGRAAVGGQGDGEGVNPLAAVFPGETIALKSGGTVTVTEWSAHALVHEVPALLGRLVSRFIPIAQAAKGKGLDATDTIIADALVGLGPAIWELVAFSTGLPPARMQALRASDFTRLILAIARQNRDFFDQLQLLYEEVGVRALVSGPIPPQPSSPPDST